jgi:excisionase family DNA binding protein
MNYVVAHLGAALAAHCRALRRDGLPVPPEIAALRDAFSAYSGQARPPLAPDDDDADAVVMPLMLSTSKAAAVCGLSERTVRRLIASGRLPAVAVGSSRRIRAADLDRFVAELPSNARETEKRS